MSDSETTAALTAALHDHFIKPDESEPGAVCLTEVTAPGGNRRADLVHIGLWASRGAGRVDVCEVKASRGDWLRELEQPAKAEAWWPYCSAYWLVSPSTAVTPASELPPGWGLMVPGGRGRRFKVIVKPEERTPKLTVPLLVTLLKCTETTRRNSVDRERRILTEKYHQQVDEIRRQRTAEANPRTAGRLEILEAIEKALGHEITGFPWGDELSPEAAGRALAHIADLEGGTDQLHRAASRASNTLQNAAKTLTEQATALAALLAGQPATTEA